MGEQLEIEITCEKDYKSLYMKMRRPLILYAIGILRDKQLSEELVQEIFKKAWEKKKQLLESPDPEKWLRRTLRNEIGNHFQREETESKHIHKVETFEEATELCGYNDDYSVIHYSDLLDREEYRILKLQIFYDMSVAEIAEEYGISISSCKKRLQRARESLRKILEKNL